MLYTIAARGGLVLQRRAAATAPPLLRLGATQQVNNARAFRVSACRCASEDESTSISDVLNKVKNSPEAIKSVQRFMQLLQQKGLNVQAGERPGMAQMAKLAMDGEVRAATMEVMNALKTAGVDASPAQMTDLISKFGKDKK